jgi:hypothetical protein
LVKLPASSPALPGDLAARAQLLHSLHQANERCIEMLAQAARSDPVASFPLVRHLREVLLGLTPDMRVRAAHKAFLFVDMQLSDASWWSVLKAHPTRTAPLPSGRGSFPKASAMHLGRATLMLAWHSVRADVASSCLLGISPAVAHLIASLSLTELDRMVERRFRYVRPRWEDRPGVWRALLASPQGRDGPRTRDVNLRALQLITGELVSASPPLQ